MFETKLRTTLRLAPQTAALARPKLLAHCQPACCPSAADMSQNTHRRRLRTYTPWARRMPVAVPPSLKPLRLNLVCAHVHLQLPVLAQVKKINCLNVHVIGHLGACAKVVPGASLRLCKVLTSVTVAVCQAAGGRLWQFALRGKCHL